MNVVGKPESLKKRSVYVYLPTEEVKELWEASADHYGLSMSKWIFHMVEESRLHLNSLYTSRELEMKERIESLQQLVDQNVERIKVLEKLKDKQDKELRKFRSLPFIDPDHYGVRSYDKALIELLRESTYQKKDQKPLSDDEILGLLGVDRSDEDSVKAISVQLANLEAYGLIASTKKGWRWKK